jgi:hypothetical protein
VLARTFHTFLETMTPDGAEKTQFLISCLFHIISSSGTGIVPTILKYQVQAFGTLYIRTWQQSVLLLIARESFTATSKSASRGVCNKIFQFLSCHLFSPVAMTFSWPRLCPGGSFPWERPQRRKSCGMEFHRLHDPSQPVYVAASRLLDSNAIAAFVMQTGIKMTLTSSSSHCYTQSSLFLHHLLVRILFHLFILIFFPFY